MKIDNNNVSFIKLFSFTISIWNVSTFLYPSLALLIYAYRKRENPVQSSEVVQNRDPEHSNRMEEVTFREAVKEVENRKAAFRNEQPKIKEELKELKEALKDWRTDAEDIKKRYEELKTVQMPIIREKTKEIEDETKKLKEELAKEFVDYNRYFESDQ